MLLARAFLDAEPGLELCAFPTVGRGKAYEALGIPILGPRRELPSGGWMMQTASAFWADLRAGFVPMTLTQLRALGRLETDILVVVGDIYGLLLSTRVRTSRRFYLQILVSANLSRSSKPHRYFMEHISAPERFLIRRTVTHTYTRDTPTAELLSRYGLAVSALGNPMLDALEPDALELPLRPPVVALLPGSRAYQEQALSTMLGALNHWPEATGLVAWTGAALPRVEGWRWNKRAPGIWAGSGIGSLEPRVFLLENRFSGVLHASQLVLGTAGTASEQAAALGKPVVSFPVPPLYTRDFLQNQHNLLGAALTVCARDPLSIAAALRDLWRDSARYEQAAKAGMARMGQAGGSAAIVRDMLKRSRDLAGIY